MSHGAPVPRDERPVLGAGRTARARCAPPARALARRAAPRRRPSPRWTPARCPPPLPLARAAAACRPMASRRSAAPRRPPRPRRAMPGRGRMCPPQRAWTSPPTCRRRPRRLPRPCGTCLPAPRRPVGAALTHVPGLCCYAVHAGAGQPKQCRASTRSPCSLSAEVTGVQSWFRCRRMRARSALPGHTSRGRQSRGAAARPPPNPRHDTPAFPLSCPWRAPAETATARLPARPPPTSCTASAASALRHASTAPPAVSAAECAAPAATATAAGRATWAATQSAAQPPTHPTTATMHMPLQG